MRDGSWVFIVRWTINICCANHGSRSASARKAAQFQSILRVGEAAQAVRPAGACLHLELAAGQHAVAGSIPDSTTTHVPVQDGLLSAFMREHHLIAIVAMGEREVTVLQLDENHRLVHTIGSRSEISELQGASVAATFRTSHENLTLSP